MFEFSQHVRLPDDEVIRRIQQRRDEEAANGHGHEYNAETYNCQHFVSEMLTGHAISWDAEKAKALIRRRLSILGRRAMDAVGEVFKFFGLG